MYNLFKKGNGFKVRDLTLILEFKYALLQVHMFIIMFCCTFRGYVGKRRST